MKKTKLEKTKLVMFDYDGVLIDSTHLPRIYYNELATLLGTRKFETHDECREFLEANVKDSLKRLGVVTPEHMKIAMDLFHKNDKKWKNLTLFPGVKEMLLVLKERGYTLAIVSNNHAETIRHDLKKNNVLGFFDHVIDKEYGYKPAPNQILHCLKITETRPEQAVMIDDMDGGIIAGRNAKLKKVIGVSYGYQLPYRLRHADIIVDSPEEILSVVE